MARAELFPDGDQSIQEVAAEAASCTRCPLYERATQTVFGEGPQPAALMLMGEVPGDKEDKAGHPFVGPAGKLLDRALADAGIDRDDVYVTNAVKHFKWRPAGKVRLHQKPNAAEIGACRVWWERELALVQPKVFGLLGATAAKAVLGSKFRVTKERGETRELPSDLQPGVLAVATIHPSSILRVEDGEQREAEFAAFTADLEAMASRLS
jgi:uracil-DNA glycosylase family protein